MTGEARDRAAYTAYVNARWATLYRFAHLVSGDAGDAEDLLQTTLVKAYVKWDRISVAESVDAYVRRMLINEMLGDRRLRGRRHDRQHLVLTEDEPDRHDPTDRIDLWQHLSALPPRQRAVLVLRYYEDFTEQQTADVLGCSRGTVKSQAHDALRTLRARLTTDEEVPR